RFYAVRFQRQQRRDTSVSTFHTGRPLTTILSGTCTITRAATTIQAITITTHTGTTIQAITITTHTGTTIHAGTTTQVDTTTQAITGDITTIGGMIDTGAKGINSIGVRVLEQGR